MTRSPYERNLGLFVLPALALLVLLFIMPIGVFFYQAFAGKNLQGAIVESSATLSSLPVRTAIVTTNLIALEVTACVLLLAYPIAFYLTRVSGLRFSIVIFCIVAPTLTSTIVRTYALMVLGGRHGVINDLLVEHSGILAAPLHLLYNRFAVVLAMVYVLLPYMVLTLFAAMKAIRYDLLQAARGLGAREFQVFSRIFLPLSLHGVISGSLMVFIFALGYYITPALVGGPRDVMIALLIQRTIESALDWSGAAEMSLFLVAATLLLYAVFCWLTDIRRLLGTRA